MLKMTPLRVQKKPIEIQFKISHTIKNKNIEIETKGYKCSNGVK